MILLWLWQLQGGRDYGFFLGGFFGVWWMKYCPLCNTPYISLGFSPGGGLGRSSRIGFLGLLIEYPREVSCGAWRE
jgi:hypothetical protein